MLIVLFVIGISTMGITMQAEKVENKAIMTSDLLGRAIQVRYTNWRGETAVRLVVPLDIFWGSTEYHTQEQWLLRLWDVERDAERIYAFKDIKGIIG